MPMTEAQPSTNGPTDALPEDACAACPHPMAAHDPIGVRYCSATAAGGLTRECVCSGKVSQRNYKRS
jgi:hypothetical protein